MSAAVALVAGCSTDPAPRPPVTPTADAPRVALAARDAAAPAAAPPRAYPAVRCSECHEKMYDEWKTSAHSRAASSPSYRRWRELARDPTCDACHAPLAPHLPAGAAASAEGVTCEVCHNIARVDVRHAGAGFELELDANIKYGPYCDAPDHYFHKMGCSPLHETGHLCGGCHLYSRTLADGTELPVFTEYDEWRAGPYRDRPCQSCHMPGETAEVATGAGTRNGVGNHGWLGRTGNLRQRALSAKVKVRVRRGKLRVEAELENERAGHYVPTGLPSRRIVVRAVIIDGAGQEIAEAEHSLGRILVNARGVEVPFYEATRVADDQRIGPKQERDVELELAVPPRGSTIRIEVLWRAFDRELAARLGITKVDEVRLLQGSIAVPESGSEKLELEAER